LSTSHRTRTTRPSLPSPRSHAVTAPPGPTSPPSPLSVLFLLSPPTPPTSTLFPYTTLFRSAPMEIGDTVVGGTVCEVMESRSDRDRKSTRLNSSHVSSSYAVFCLKKKKALSHRLRQEHRTGVDTPAPREPEAPKPDRPTARE